jgi:hypothetical protein
VGRGLIIGLICVLVGVVAGAALLITSPNGQSDVSEELPMSALDGEMAPSDRLPRSLLHSSTGEQFSKPLQSAHALSTGGSDYYIVQGSHGQLCTERIFEKPVPSYSTTCGPSGQVEKVGSIWTAAVDRPGGKLRIYGIVADGYDTATLRGESATVRNNMFALETNQTTGKPMVMLTGPTVPTRAVAIGSMGTGKHEIRANP